MYTGDLSPVFDAVRGALWPGKKSLFAFTTELLCGDDPDGACDAPWKLDANTKRFAHSEGYIRALASAHGLREVAREELVLRREHGEDVRGQLFVLGLAGFDLSDDAGWAMLMGDDDDDDDQWVIQ